MSCPQPIGKFVGCNHIWGRAKLDEQIVRTMEYGMTDFMKSCIDLDSNLIDGIVPGSSKRIKLADLLADASGGGDAS